MDYELSTPNPSTPGEPRRAVTLVVAPEWAQALTRLQQLYHEGVTVFRLLEDERRIVRISAEMRDKPE